MAKVDTLVSDLSGKEINGSHAKVSIRIGDVVYVGDANADEVTKLTEKLNKQKPRGRKPAAKK